MRTALLALACAGISHSEAVMAEVPDLKYLLSYQRYNPLEYPI